MYAQNGHKRLSLYTLGAINRTFKWSNEAKGNAAVHVVIIGFTNLDIPNKKIFEYEDINADPHEIFVKNINPYLVEGKDFVILKRNTPISTVPEISFGSMPNDGGYFLFTDEEKNEFLKVEPNAKKFVKPILSTKHMDWKLFAKTDRDRKSVV